MKYKPNWDPDQPYIEDRINWAARGLLGKFGFTQPDIQDIQNELLLDLLLRLQAYNPEKAQRRTFISLIIRNQAKTIIEERKAKKRGHTVPTFSLDEELLNLEGELKTKLFELENKDYQDRIFGRFITEQPSHVQRIHFKRIKSSLPFGYQPVWELLSLGERPTDIARDLKISRSAVYTRMEGIRRRLLRLGYGSEKSPDTFQSTSVCRNRRHH